MTSSQQPKHILPVAGIPSILRLLDSLSNMPQIVILIAADDTETLAVVQQVATLTNTNASASAAQSSNLPPPPPSALLSSAASSAPPPIQQSASSASSSLPSFARWNLVKGVGGGTQMQQPITLLQLSEDCFGSVDALRQLEQATPKIVAESTHLVVLPGDLVVLDQQLVVNGFLSPGDATNAACTTLLVDVGEQDEHGIPLKESAKVCVCCVGVEVFLFAFMQKVYSLKACFCFCCWLIIFVSLTLLLLLFILYRLGEKGRFGAR
jgi:hypothetical protein